MPTPWTDDPATTSTHIHAIHVNELRGAVDCSRAAYGWPAYSWTDNPVSSSTPIRAVHFNEIRSAIQELWDRKAMGPIPWWTVGSAPSSARPISARDINDLRGWLNTYETNPIGAVYDPLRGLHLRNGADMRPEDIAAARMFDPKMVVVLANEANQFTQLLNYLKSLASDVEIFCRWYPTTYPPQGYVTFEGYSEWLTLYGGGAALPLDGISLAQQIIQAYDSLLSKGLQVTRWFPGNEPELEWFQDPTVYQWLPHTWVDINYYYRDVYHYLQVYKGSRPIELYPPAFAAFSSVGVGNYWPDGSVSRYRLSPGGPDPVPPDHIWEDGERGLDLVQDVIDYYTNDTGVGRVLWHSYFWPARQAQQSAYNFFPDWLKDRIAAGYPSRITEFGWYPDAFTGDCNANLDTTTTPCGGPPGAITSWGDYNDFVRSRAGAGGAAFFLLSSISLEWQPFAGVTNDNPGVLRPWLKKYACMLNANL